MFTKLQSSSGYKIGDKVVITSPPDDLSNLRCEYKEVVSIHGMKRCEKTKQIFFNVVDDDEVRFWINKDRVWRKV